MCQFLGKKRIARCLPAYVHYYLLRQLGVGNKCADNRIAERLDLQRTDRVFALHVRDERTQGMFRSKFDLPARTEKDNWGAGQSAYKISEQFAATGIGPLQIVQHDKQR